MASDKACGNSGTLANQRVIVDLAAKHRLPAIYPSMEFVGGLVVYGVNYPDHYRRAASFADKIFKGAKSADLPVEQPTKFDLVINLKTAKALTPRELTQRRRVLFTMLTVLDFRYAPGPEPPMLPALRAWLGGWPGIGRIVAGLTRQGLDLQLTRYGSDGWRANVFSAGIAHSMTSSVGTARAPDPWVAVQRAAWDALRRREGEAA